MKVKKVTYFGEFCYLKSSWIRKSITLMFLSSSRNKFTLLYQNSVTDVFVGFLPPCWCPSRWAPAWRLHTNFYKFVQNISSDIAYTEYSSDLNLGEGLCMFTSFHFPYFLFYLVNRFDFYFDYIEWRDTENKQLSSFYRLAQKSWSTLACYEEISGGFEPIC